MEGRVCTCIFIGNLEKLEPKNINSNDFFLTEIFFLQVETIPQKVFSDCWNLFWNDFHLREETFRRLHINSEQAVTISISTLLKDLIRWHCSIHHNPKGYDENRCSTSVYDRREPVLIVWLQSYRTAATWGDPSARSKSRSWLLFYMWWTVTIAMLSGILMLPNYCFFPETLRIDSKHVLQLIFSVWPSIGNIKCNIQNNATRTCYLPST